MTVKNFRIIVDNQFYNGETECELNTWHSDPHSNFTFQTQKVTRNVLTFDPTRKNFKLITGYINLIGELKKIIEFIRNTDLMAGKTIVIEAEPFFIPITINLEKILSNNDELKIKLEEYEKECHWTNIQGTFSTYNAECNSSLYIFEPEFKFCPACGKRIKYIVAQ